jgi:hypothetical protein
MECNGFASWRVQSQNKHSQEIGMEKDLLPAAGKESVRVISKEIHSPNK